VVYIEQSLEDPYQQRVQVIACLEEIVAKMENKYDIDFNVGIGRAYNDQDIMKSYQEASKALHHKDDDKILHIDDIAPNISNAGFEILAEEHRLLDAIENGDVKKCLSILSDIFQRYPNYFEQEGLKYSLIEIMVAAHRIALENGIDSDKDIEYGQFIKQILSCDSETAFAETCMEKIRDIASCVSNMKKKTIGNIVEKANRLIDEKFSQELTLDDISKELYISPQYFSRLYKSEMGVNFIERLTAVRIENAKRLMKESDYSVKEICFMSGYSDPNYFSRLFKKHEGVSPSEYLKQV
jgi:two-component system response regulator YesN